jgi:hypothetical protein
LAPVALDAYKAYSASKKGKGSRHAEYVRQHRRRHPQPQRGHGFLDGLLVQLKDQVALAQQKGDQAAVDALKQKYEEIQKTMAVNPFMGHGRKGGEVRLVESTYQGKTPTIDQLKTFYDQAVASRNMSMAALIKEKLDSLTKSGHGRKGGENPFWNDDTTSQTSTMRRLSDADRAAAAEFENTPFGQAMKKINAERGNGKGGLAPRTPPTPWSRTNTLGPDGYPVQQGYPVGHGKGGLAPRHPTEQVPPPHALGHPVGHGRMGGVTPMSETDFRAKLAELRIPFGEKQMEDMYAQYSSRAQQNLGAGWLSDLAKSAVKAAPSVISAVKTAAPLALDAYKAYSAATKKPVAGKGRKGARAPSERNKLVSKVMKENPGMKLGEASKRVSAMMKGGAL